MLSAPKRPALRYHGGKWKLAPWIISHFPAHRIYVEPFGGAASVLLRKHRVYSEVYNDLDGEIVNLFRVLRDTESACRLQELLELTPFARDEFLAAYEVADDPIEQARRTIIKSFMGFGSAAITFKNGSGFRPIGPNPPTGFRANSNRSGRTPAHDWANFPENVIPTGFRSFTRPNSDRCGKSAAADFATYEGTTGTLCARLQGVVIENRPAIDVMKQHDGPNTLHYVDPPYVHMTRSKKNTYCHKHEYRHEMTNDQHGELSVFLHSVKGAVVLSGYRCVLYDDLYHDWTRYDRSAHADGARHRVESLWINRVNNTLFSC